MPDPNKFSIWDALIPILGGAAAAYSPRYLGQGVQAGAGLYGAMQNQKRYAQQNTIEQAFRDKQLLEEQKQTAILAKNNDALISQALADQQLNEANAKALSAEFVPQDPNMSIMPEPKTAAYIEAVNKGMPFGTARNALTPPAAPKPAAEARPEYPFATGTGGIYNKERGTWSVPPPTRTPAGPKAASVEGQIIQLDREIRQISEALKFADPNQEAEYQSQLEDAIAGRDQLKSQRPARAGGRSSPNPTVQVNIPGVHTDAGKRLAAKYLGK
jgi:hypothetical protein